MWGLRCKAGVSELPRAAARTAAMGKKNKKSDDEEAEAEAPEPEPVAAEEEDDVPEGDTFGALLRECAVGGVFCVYGGISLGALGG